jgi:hypothetical protein
MSRSNSALATPALDAAPHADAGSDAPADFVYTEQPTRPLPKFVLAEEARRLDAANARDDEDRTVTVSADENKKLLESVFAAAPDGTMPTDRANTDDEPTLDAPSPVADPAFDAAPPRPVRVTARPPALRTLVITKPAPSRMPAPAAILSPQAVPPAPPPFPRAAPALVMTPALIAPPAAPAVVAAPVSGFRPKITPELANAARVVRDAEERRRKDVTFTIRLPKRSAQTYLVAGIWAMALSLFVVLMLMATSA